MSAKRSATMKREAREIKAKSRELQGLLNPVGPGYMPKGGAAAARAANDQWLDGRARDSAIRSGVPVGVAVWAVVAASAGALLAEASVIWLVFSL